MLTEALATMGGFFMALLAIRFTYQTLRRVSRVLERAGL